MTCYQCKDPVPIPDRSADIVVREFPEFEIVKFRLIEDKPVTEEVIQTLYSSSKEINRMRQDGFDIGFRAALDYLGVPVTEEGKR